MTIKQDPSPGRKSCFVFLCKCGCNVDVIYPCVLSLKEESSIYRVWTPAPQANISQNLSLTLGSMLLHFLHPVSVDAHRLKIRLSFPVPFASRWSIPITSSGWSSLGWLNCETPKWLYTANWRSAVRTWPLLTLSASIHQPPTSACLTGAARKPDQSRSTSAPQSPTACCSSATGTHEVHASTDPGLTFLPWNCWTAFCTSSWTWARAALS